MNNFCIIHYNTPELTNCLIKSINKYCNNSHIYLFDNSTKKPFINTYDNLTIYDNTNGQYINFDKYIKENLTFKDSPGYISIKHCLSVQKCIELIDDNFILLDSDVLLKSDITFLINDNYCAIGFEDDEKSHYHKRLCPFLLYINVKMCKKYNINFFNKNLIWGLTQSPDNLDYDTGSSFLFEIKKNKLPYIGTIPIWKYILHFGHASWKPNKQQSIDEWLKINKDIYEE